MIANPIQSKIDRLLSEAETAKRQYRQEKIVWKDVRRHTNALKKAQEIAQTIAVMVEKESHKQISGTVSYCLSEVFGNDYQFEIIFTRKRNKTQAELTLKKDGHPVGNALENDSGGVADISSFALRLSCLMLQKPRVRKILILDEPFKFCSKEYREIVADMLKTLSEKLKVQILLVTHQTEFQVGRVIEL